MRILHNRVIKQQSTNKVILVFLKKSNNENLYLWFPLNSSDLSVFTLKKTSAFQVDLSKVCVSVKWSGLQAFSCPSAQSSQQRWNGWLVVEKEELTFFLLSLSSWKPSLVTSPSSIWLIFFSKTTWLICFPFHRYSRILKGFHSRLCALRITTYHTFISVHRSFF